MQIVGALNHYLKSSIIIGIVVFLIIRLIIFFILKTRKNENIKIDISSWIFQFVLIVYIVGVLNVTGGIDVFKNGISEYSMSPNIIPIITTIQDIMENPSGMLEQIIYNIVLFIPLGFLLPKSMSKIKWNIKKIVLSGLFMIFIVEGLEYLTGRYFDIDDFIINSVGVIAGYFMYLFLKKILHSK